jgi:RNA polymerase sigma-54 factor
MLRQQLTQKQIQKLSPLQIQQARLLELTGLEIEKRIDQELVDNPALEETDSPPEEEEDSQQIVGDETNASDAASQEDLSIGDYRSDDDMPDYEFRQTNYSAPKNDGLYYEADSLQDFLLDQLYLINLTEKQKKIGDYLIGNVDGDGYIRRSAEALADDLAFQYGIDATTEEVAEILDMIRDFDPSGVGASSLKDCLILQLQRKEPNESRDLAIRLLNEYFDLITRRLYERLIRLTEIPEDKIKEAINEITQLNPRPGSAWESNAEIKLSHITPDFVVEAMDGELILTINEKIPELVVSPKYDEMLTDYSSQNAKQSRDQRDALNFVRQKIDSAKWFIDAIRQRHITLRKTMLAIMKLQRDFFLTGDESKLKPMILKDVAEEAGYDVSTISRVSNSKYVQTNFGVYQLKYFFSGVAFDNEGEEISKREVITILKKCIDNEDKLNPLNDEQLTQTLRDLGYDVARRTVAKYREQLDIPISRLRREL